MKIVYLLHNLYGIGGTIRTVVNQAEALADLGHDVEVVSVFRYRDDPVFPLSPRVRTVSLVDVRAPRGPGADRPSRLYPTEEKLYGTHSALTDALIAERLAESAPDVVVGTRAGLNILLARLRPDGAAVVGQEHLTHRMYDPALMRAMSRDYRRLDAVAPVTEADAATYRARMHLPGVRVQAVPNCVPAPALRASGEGPPCVVAAGRITGMKGFDLLLEAFVRVARDHPDWTLRVFGRGRGLEARRRQIHALGLEDRAFMMGAHPRMDEVWPMASLGAVSSRDEPFGMILVEAMRAGVPVLSSNCPHGPAEILRHGEDGLLVENEDPDALARGLDRLMGDDGLRLRMGEAALRNSERYSPEAVARTHESLFRDLVGTRGTGSVSGTAGTDTTRDRDSASFTGSADSGGGTAKPEEPVVPVVPVVRTGADPHRCTASLKADGGLELRFASPPGLVVLRPVGAGAAGRAERRLCPEGARTVHLDPHDFPEGTTRWEVLRSADAGGAEDADGTPDTEGSDSAEGSDGAAAATPVPASLLDLRSAPHDPRTVKRLAVALPERGADGRLRVAVRRADRFAEVGGVSVTAERIAVSGTVLGVTGPDLDAVLVLRARGGGTELRFACPVDAAGRFHGLLPVDALIEASGAGAGPATAASDGDGTIWDVRLHGSRGDHLVGRCLLGPGDWKRACPYPAAEAVRAADNTADSAADSANGSDGSDGKNRTDVTRNRVRVRPYYTDGGHLAVRIGRKDPSDLPAVAAASPLERGAAVGEVSLCWIPRQARFEATGTVRTHAVAPDTPTGSDTPGAPGAPVAPSASGALTVRLVRDRDGASVPLPVSCAHTAAGVRFTATVDLEGPGRLPFGRWRLEVEPGGGSPTRAAPSSPGPLLRRRWWRGPMPVYATAGPAPKGGVAVEYAPVRLLLALRRRLPRIPGLRRLRSLRRGA